MSRFIVSFGVRWLVNSLGLWMAYQLLGDGYGSIEVNTSISVFLVAGFVFSLVNSILKPVIVILSLPAILLTLGLFMLIVNGLMVYISLKIAPGISMTFFNSILTGIILSLLNYIISTTLLVRPSSAS
jgi:putative membrane protein